MDMSTAPKDGTVVMVRYVGMAKPLPSAWLKDAWFVQAPEGVKLNYPLVPMEWKP